MSECNHNWYYPIDNDPTQPLIKICWKCNKREYRSKDLELEYW